MICKSCGSGVVDGCRCSCFSFAGINEGLVEWTCFTKGFFLAIIVDVSHRYLTLKESKKTVALDD